MKEKLERLKEILGQVDDLNAASALLHWDQQTYMPRGGAEARGRQSATLRRLYHERFTSEEVGRLLEDLAPLVEQMPPDSDERRLVKVMRRLYHKAVKVPSELVAELSLATTAAYEAWVQARAEKDFARFQPHLEKILDLRRRYAGLFAPYDHIYDPLLDDYEPGLKTAKVQAIFSALRPQQVELIRAIASRPQVDDAFLHKSYDEKEQWDFSAEVITRFGYDWNRGRMDKSPHPFTTGFGLDDVRITVRLYPDYPSAMLFGAFHETGHALYDLGIDRALDRTTLASGTSLSLHESQSRLWENLVGRSLPFWEYFYPRLQQRFRSQLGNVPLESFYKGINKVTPSLIRVEADETTYNLHIMLRLELEIALLEGSLLVRDLPEAWNACMQEYLGLTPLDDAQGVLQDIHWSEGYFGYFSTYALGNLISAQLWERILVDIPDLYDQFRQGEFAALCGWLAEKVHRHGAKFESQELLERVTGSRIDPAPYIRYLRQKYVAIYGF